ncbi:MAG: hypothetical protein P4K94_11325 [Terracidiphilus sp.]|nr:hypothetical protein [Terracidiphilus sp.]
MVLKYDSIWPACNHRLCWQRKLLSFGTPGKMTIAKRLCQTENASGIGTGLLSERGF